MVKTNHNCHVASKNEGVTLQQESDIVHQVSTAVKLVSDNSELQNAGDALVSAVSKHVVQDKVGHIADSSIQQSDDTISWVLWVGAAIHCNVEAGVTVVVNMKASITIDMSGTHTDRLSLEVDAVVTQQGTFASALTELSVQDHDGHTIHASLVTDDMIKIHAACTISVQLDVKSCGGTPVQLLTDASQKLDISPTFKDVPMEQDGKVQARATRFDDMTESCMAMMGSCNDDHTETMDGSDDGDATVMINPVCSKDGMIALTEERQRLLRTRSSPSLIVSLVLSRLLFLLLLLVRLALIVLVLNRRWFRIYCMLWRLPFILALTLTLLNSRLLSSLKMSRFSHSTQNTRC